MGAIKSLGCIWWINMHQIDTYPEVHYITAHIVHVTESSSKAISLIQMRLDIGTESAELRRSGDLTHSGLINSHSKVIILSTNYLAKFKDQVNC